MNKKFDKKINQKISKTEVTPSADLWDKIEAELPEEKKKKGFFFLPLLGAPMFKTAMAASVMFLLGGLSTYYFMNNNITKNSAKSKNTNSEFNINNQQNRNQTLITESQSEVNKNLEIDDEKKSSDLLISNNKYKKSKKDNTIFNSKNNTSQIAKNIYSNVRNTNRASAYYNSQSNANILVSSSNETSSSNMQFGTKTSDYKWIYDNKTGAYSVVPKNLSVQNSALENNNNLFANDLKTDSKEEVIESSFMSIIEEVEKEKQEVLKETEDEPVLKAFNSKSNRINYKGFWLGPQVGFEGIFVAENFYSGGSFGIDIGYDFGSSWGLQTGLKYAINSKIISVEQDGKSVAYKSEFNSLHLPLYARYKFTKITQSYARPLSLNLIGGLDYAFVNQKNLHQVGLNIGAEYDIFTQADLMFTIGVKGGMYNNLNLYKLDIPERINRYNYLVNAYLSVRFIDWVKKN